MRQTAEARLRSIAARERDYAYPIAMPEPDILSVERAADLAKAAQDLIDNLHLRYPGEDFTCPFIRALDRALACI